MFKIDWEKANIKNSIPKEIIYKMVALAFPKGVLSSYKIIEGGCANLNIIIQLSNNNKIFILRIYLRDKMAAFREQKLALLLKDIIPIASTHYIGEINNYCFAIVDYLYGQTLRDFIIKKPLSNTTYELIYETGNILAKISTFKFNKAGFFDSNLNVISDNSSNVNLINYSKECLNNDIVKTVLEKQTILEIENLIVHYRDLLPDYNSKNLVHGDFDPANILVAKIEGEYKISGILDWEFAFAGSTLWDIATMLRYAHKMSPKFQTSFIEALERSGIKLYNPWHTTLNLLNLLSLLDCLKRSDIKQTPNRCADIRELINHILQELKLYG